MKYFFPILLLLSLAGCAKDDPALPNDAPDRTVVCRAGDGTRSAPEPGTLALGKQLENPFSLENMQEAMTALRSRSLPNAGTGQMTGTILEEYKRLRTKIHMPTHLYVRFDPRTAGGLERLLADTTLTLFPFPLDQEILGEGAMPRRPAKLDIETGKVSFAGPVEPLYAVVPVYQELPEEVESRVLDKFFLPRRIDDRMTDATGIEPLSDEFAQILTDQARMLVDDFYEDYEYRFCWYPSGKIEVYDTKMKRYVGVPGVKVFVRNEGAVHSTYTNEDGEFQIPWKCYGEVTYGIRWETEKCRMLDQSMCDAIYYGPTSDKPWHMQISESYHPAHPFIFATVDRALYYHYNGSHPFDRSCRSEKVTVACWNDPDPEGTAAGRFYGGNSFPTINIYGIKNSNQYKQSANLFNTTSHEMGHCAMYDRCKKEGVRFSNFDKIIKESWATMIGWYMLEGEYAKYNYSITERVAYDTRFNKPYPINGGSMIRPLIEDFLIYYSVPNGFNKQGMTKAAYMDNDPNADSKYYTPLFIDLVDDSNQADYYRLFEVESSDDPLEVTYVNDNIEIKAYYLLNDLLYHSNTLVQLKANLLNEADQLRITEEAIEEFFEFYNI
ncbi:carboxypeptidase-like regulatory domain-containing protein [uncultured Alistipes sp.]|uniref:carboxypeptidase-like regulatory domain-containing protein n=1 Tax=uncultured Alistipes sp. TaxID=538949 RepID=UPI00262D71E2|nr:carboxypeptidase-like regulatory domain-containing protein [uncultured Alistipes sp.]